MSKRKRFKRTSRDQAVLRAAVWLSLSAGLAVGCEGPFGPPTLVDRLRLLEIQAEPPEISLDDTRVEFAAVIGNPREEALQCRWAVCWIQLGWAAAEINCPADDSFFFGEQCDSASLDLVALASWLEQHGWGDFSPAELPPELEETDLPLFVGLEILGGGKRLRGLKRLRLNWEGDEPNTNPVLLGMNAEDGLPVENPLVVRVGQRVKLKPLADETSRQSFINQDGEQRREDFLFSWFATAGSFRDRRTILGKDSAGHDLEENEWFLDPAYSTPGPARLWLVLRDGRWGSSWLEFQCLVQESP